MFCLVFSQSRLCAATIIFYTCIWIPFLHIKQYILALLNCLLLSLGMTTCQQMENLQLQVIAAASTSSSSSSSSSSTSCIQDYYYSCQRYYDNQQQQQQQELEDEEVLPVVRFEDHFYLRNLNNDHGSSSSRAVVECSVCLGEFRSEDEVSQLRGCGHLFHLQCIKSWLDRNRFTCPLCRSVFLNAAQFYRAKYSSASSYHHPDHHSVDYTT